MCLCWEICLALKINNNTYNNTRLCTRKLKANRLSICPYSCSPFVKLQKNSPRYKHMLFIVNKAQKPCKLIFSNFEYLVWLVSSFQALSIGTTYMVLECI